MVNPLATAFIGFREIPIIIKLYIPAIIKNIRHLISWFHNQLLIKNQLISITTNIHSNWSQAFFWNFGKTFNLPAIIIAHTINIVSISTCTIIHPSRFHFGITNKATKIQATTHVKFILKSTFCFSKDTNR